MDREEKIARLLCEQFCRDEGMSCAERIRHVDHYWHDWREDAVEILAAVDQTPHKA